VATDLTETFILSVSEESDFEVILGADEEIVEEEEEFQELTEVEQSIKNEVFVNLDYELSKGEEPL